MGNRIETTVASGATAAGGISPTDLSTGFSGASTKYDGLVRDAAARYGVPERLVKAVIKQESAFNSRAESHCGAQGLMQLMPGTARELGVTNPFDAKQNIDGGTRYLAGLLRRYNGDVSLALAAYNAGAGNVNKYGGVPPFKETRGYVANITGNFSGTRVDVPPLGELTARGVRTYPNSKFEILPAWFDFSRLFAEVPLGGWGIEEAIDDLQKDHPGRSREELERELLERNQGALINGRFPAGTRLTLPEHKPTSDGYQSAAAPLVELSPSDEGTTPATDTSLLPRPTRTIPG
ncbi:MAG: lytic transglycosylase domain-containing protein [Myxococcaceae bacterium]